MWIFSTLGFMSVVDVGDGTGDLLVRTRDKETIVGVVDGVTLLMDSDAPDLIINDPEWIGAATDYPYRVRVNREDFVQWLAHDIREYLNYTNFKTALAESRGEPYETVSHKVWADALGLTEPGQEDFGFGYARSFSAV